MGKTYEVNVDLFEVDEGSKGDPQFVQYRRGDKVELDSETAERLLKHDSVVAPGDTGDALDSLRKPELEELAEQHGVDLSDASNNDERAQSLRDAGVTASEE